MPQPSDSVRASGRRDDVGEVAPQVVEEWPLSVGGDVERNVVMHSQCLGEVARLLHEDDESLAFKPPPERHLVVVGDLAVACQPRNDDRTLSVGEANEDRPDAAVGDDEPCAPDLLDGLRKREIGDTARVRRANRGRAMLHEQRLVGLDVLDGPEKPIERWAVRPCDHEDH